MIGKLWVECWPAWIMLVAMFIAGFVLIYRNYGVGGGLDGFMDIQQIMAMIQSKQRQQKSLQGYNELLGYIYQNPSASGPALNDMKRRLFSADCTFQYNWHKVGKTGIGYGANKADGARAAYMNWMRCIADGNPGCYEQVNDAMRRFMGPGCKADVKSANVLRDNTNVSMLFM
jgi:hypothetical protein